MKKHHKHRSEVIFESCCDTSGAIRYWILRRTVGSLTHPCSSARCATPTHSLTLAQIHQHRVRCKKFCPHVAVMGCWMVLGKVVSPVCCAGPPVKSELFLICPVSCLEFQSLHEQIWPSGGNHRSKDLIHIVGAPFATKG
eukprot:scaffold124602_cov42-Cyclotella_meneghiniana.AAC.2